MLMPKKVKYRKQQRGRMAGKAWTGGTLAFGDYGLKASECGWVTAREIEAGRIAITRFIKRNGRIWIRMFPDKPYTKKPQETRMGKGKGGSRGLGDGGQARAHPVRDGRRAGGGRAQGAAARRPQAVDQHPHRDAGRRILMKPAKVREMGKDELKAKERELQEQLFKLRVQQSIGQLDNAIKLRETRREIARVKTVMREKQVSR